jgi:ribosomal protein L29
LQSNMATKTKNTILKPTEMTPAELNTQVKLLREKIVKFQMDKTIGKSKNVREGFIMRKKLARLLGALNK